MIIDIIEYSPEKYFQKYWNFTTDVQSFQFFREFFRWFFQLMEIPLDRWRFPLEGGHVLRSHGPLQVDSSRLTSAYWAQRAEYIHNVPAERKCHSFRNQKMPKMKCITRRYKNGPQIWKTMSTSFSKSRCREWSACQISWTELGMQAFEAHKCFVWKFCLCTTNLPSTAGGATVSYRASKTQTCEVGTNDFFSPELHLCTAIELSW